MSTIVWNGSQPTPPTTIALVDRPTNSTLALGQLWHVSPGKTAITFGPSSTHDVCLPELDIDHTSTLAFDGKQFVLCDGWIETYGSIAQIPHGTPVTSGYTCKRYDTHFVAGYTFLIVWGENVLASEQFAQYVERSLGSSALVSALTGLGTPRGLQQFRSLDQSQDTTMKITHIVYLSLQQLRDARSKFSEQATNGLFAKIGYTLRKNFPNLRFFHTAPPYQHQSLIDGDVVAFLSENDDAVALAREMQTHIHAVEEREPQYMNNRVAVLAIHTRAAVCQYQREKLSLCMEHAKSLLESSDKSTEAVVTFQV